MAQRKVKPVYKVGDHCPGCKVGILVIDYKVPILKCPECHWSTVFFDLPAKTADNGLDEDFFDPDWRT